MRLKILASDLDGTLTEGHTIPSEMWQVLRQGRDGGLALILVTGRTLDLIDLGGAVSEIFEAVVAENGAAIYLPRILSTFLALGVVAPDLLAELEARAYHLFAARLLQLEFHTTRKSSRC